MLAFTLRTPSPGPPLSAELSTIMEADNSGVSKHNTLPNPSPPPTATRTEEQHTIIPISSITTTTHENLDASALLDLSTTNLEDQVQDAILQGEGEWLNADKPVIIIDGDEHPDVADTTFNMDTVDPELVALLNPTKELPPPISSVVSPTSPASRLPRARQASSFLPRLRPSNPTSQFPIPTSSPITPKTSPSIVVNPTTPKTPVSSSSSPALSSSSLPTAAATATASTSTPITSRRNITLNPKLFSPSTPNSPFPTSRGTTKVFGGGKQPPQVVNNDNGSTATVATPNLATRTLRQVMLGVRTIEAGGTPTPLPSASSITTTTSSPCLTLGRTSLDSSSARLPTDSGSIGLGLPSLDVHRGASSSSSSIQSTAINRPSTSPARTETVTTTTTATTATEADSSSTPSPEDTPLEEYYRPSLESNMTTRPSFDGIIISRPNSASRSRDWDGLKLTTTPTPTTASSLRVMDTGVRDRASPVPRLPIPSTARMRKRSMSVQERLGGGAGGGGGGGRRMANAATELGVRPGSSLSAYAGSRTTRGGGGGGGGGGGMLGLGRLLRDRSGSTSGILSPSPLDIGNPASTLNRFASLRSASEYNPIHGRSHSRLALSEVGTGGSGRRGSESFSPYGGSGGGGGGSSSSYGHSGLMESPTFTVSSGSRDRDTPKSSTTSTAPTSLADSFGYLGRGDRSERDLNRDREREREREDMRELKERHGTEMGALLGALSDSQRTVRVLREENSDLRDRLERLTLVVQASEELRQACGDLQSECNGLKRENMDLRRELRTLKSTTNNNGLNWSSSSSTGLRTPVPKTASGSSPLARTFTPTVVAAQDDEEEAEAEYDNTFIDHGSEVENHHHHHYRHHSHSKDSDYTPTNSSGAILPSSSSSSIPSQKRRLSNSSSIFPIPPSNMTLLLHEDATATLGSIAGGNRSSTDHSQYGFSLPPTTTFSNSSSSSSQRKTHIRSLSQSSSPISYHSFAANVPNTSITSVGSISPSTANFSMVTGSPGSLFLRPEHEILLGDMESLDLGIQCGDGELVDEKVDEW